MDVEKLMPEKKQNYFVTLQPGNLCFSVAADETILVAALRAGIAMPSSCRNGTCRACMLQCLSGQVSYRIAWPGLSREEKADAWILPCVAYPESDLLIETASA